MDEPAPRDRAKVLRDSSAWVLSGIAILIAIALAIFVFAGSIAAEEQNSVYSKARSIETRLENNDRKLDELVKKLADSKTEAATVSAL